MGTFITILGLIVAVLVAVVELVGDRWPKRRKRIVQVFIVVAGIVIAASQLLFPDKTKDDVHGLERTVDSLKQVGQQRDCTIDSLRQLVYCMAGPEGINSECFGQAFNEAVCVNQTGLAKSASDSMLVAIGLGEYDRAIELLPDVLTAVSDDSAKTAEGYLYAAAAHCFNQRWDAVIAMLDSAIVYKHDKHEAWNNRAVSLASVLRFDEALASCDSAEKYNPLDPDIRELRRLIREMQQMTEDTVR